MGGQVYCTRPRSLAPSGGDGYAPAGACSITMMTMNLRLPTTPMITKGVTKVHLLCEVTDLSFLSFNLLQVPTVVCVIISIA